MSRLAAKLRLGHFPLAEREAVRIRACLFFAGVSSVLDPCAGTGAALAAITRDAQVRRYAIELDAVRARECGRVVDEIIHGSAFEVHAPAESFGLLFANPPYQHEIGEGRNQRLEKSFFEHTWRWLKPGGVLVFVVPFDRIREVRAVLAAQFRDKAIYRLTEPEAAAYKQAVVFGVRRTRLERDRLTDRAVQQAASRLDELTRRYDDIPALPDTPDRTYLVPETAPARIEYRGIPIDIVEDLLQSSPARIQARRVTHATQPRLSGRPLIPLKQAHVGLLCTASLLNGRFGAGADTHLSYWESVKVRDRVEEETAKGVEIRERERFSQRLTLLYATGKFLLLSEKPARGQEAQDGECSSQNGPPSLPAGERRCRN